MNALKKLIFQACFISCLIPGVAFASQPESVVSAQEAERILSMKHEQAAKQTNEIQADLHHLIQLITSKKLPVADIAKTREELMNSISVLENQKQATIQVTPENIDQLSIINKVCIEYFLHHISGKIDAISCNNLIESIQNFFTALSNGSKTLGTFDEILAENDTNLKKLSSGCDTAGLTQLNKIIRSCEQSSVFQYAKPAAIIGGATIAAAIVLTYVLFQKPIEIGTNVNTGLPIMDIKFNQQGFNSTFPSSLHEPANKLFSNIVKPSADLAHGFGISLLPQFNVSVLGVLGAALLPYSKDVKDFASNQLQKLYNYARGETGSPKNFLQGAASKKVYFDELIGSEHLKKEAEAYIKYVLNPESYDRTGTAPERGVLLVGPPQTGKTFFAQALHTAIDEALADSGKFGFIIVDHDLLSRITLEQIFEFAKLNAPYIIFIDEIDMLGADREKNPYNTGQLLTCMTRLNEGGNGKKVFVLAATNKPEQLDFALLQDGRFGKSIPFTYPKFAARKAMITKLLYDKAIEISEDFITQLAQETEGLSFNSITAIITEAMRSAKQAARLVTAQDIDNAFDKEVRKIDPYTSAHASLQEKQAIAAYQAGKAAAYIACNPEQKLAKVTIKPIIKKIEPKAGFEFSLKNSGDNTPEIKKDQPFTKESYRLGGVFTYHEIDACALKNSDDQEHEIMCLLAGKIAQKMLLGKTYSKVCLEDIAQAKGFIHSLCEDPLLTKDEILKQSHALETQLEAKISEILIHNKDLIEKLYKALLEKETLDRNLLKKFTA